MSEIKGQLLGILITIGVFGVVLTGMKLAFSNASSTIAEKVVVAAETATGESGD